ncbi:Fatty acid synthase [Holothuria leucospilota]|uniref:Fatty acid synthase n=1 Tax=Holothuria leucospilota TaxID=206669 RepID=A0A9Q0YS20_HOLLE|nr:Fatty acid synthase [Holothuria leucospilota]
MVFSPVNREGVMVCGMSCRLPGCDNVNEVWDQLVSKVNLVTTNKSRWDPAYLGLPETSGNLKDISKFDASFFGILPKQVNKMDPQLRLLLEVSYEAIVDAGKFANSIWGSTCFKKKIVFYIRGKWYI